VGGVLFAFVSGVYLYSIRTVNEGSDSLLDDEDLAEIERELDQEQRQRLGVRAVDPLLAASRNRGQ